MAAEIEVHTERRGIQSVDAALSILEVVASGAGPQSLGTIAKRSDNAASTTHRYLASLQRGGLVSQDPATGLYDLGPGALRLGSRALMRLDAIGVAQTVASKLSIETGLTTFLSIWSERGPLIIRWYVAQRPLLTSSGVGSVLPLMLSSAGRIFAAYLPQRTVELCMKESDPPLSYACVRHQLHRIRDEGFAWIDGSIITGLRGISVPILDIQGEVSSVLTLLGTHPELVQFPNQTLDRLVAAGHTASQNLGFMGVCSSNR